MHTCLWCDAEGPKTAELLNDPNPARAGRVAEANRRMAKIDLAGIERAVVRA